MDPHQQQHVPVSNVNQPSAAMPPPAGGVSDAEVGRKVLEALHRAGIVVPGTKTRTWSDKMIDASVPTIQTIVIAVGCYAGMALVERQFGKADARKRMASSTAAAAGPSPTMHK